MTVIEDFAAARGRRAKVVRARRNKNEKKQLRRNNK